MFGKLKEKLKSWTKKISENIEEKEEPLEIKKEPEKIIKTPLIFKPGTQKYEPDLEILTEEIKQIKDSQEKDKLKKDLEDIEERLQEEPKKPEAESFFKKIGSKISKVKISEKEFEIYAEELEMLLLENNVALEVTEKIIQRLKQEVVGKELLKKEIESEIKDFFRDIVEEILIEPFDIHEKIKEKNLDQSKEPYVILFCGINGTGKTTSIAKIADSLKKKGVSCVLAAADTFRAASIEQIKKHGEILGIKVISNEYGADPASVGFDAIKYAKKNFINCVLIDTAGRMHTSKNLIKEIEKISKVCKPDLTVFVGESLTGNDIIEQVKSFDWAIGIDGIILTKADIDEKGGTALSVGYVTKKPILYLGTGQEYDAIEPFDKKKFIEKLGL
ncbi:MAG: signal recognition particle-docking protein FtsY [archaeon]